MDGTVIVARLLVLLLGLRGSAVLLATPVDANLGYLTPDDYVRAVRQMPREDEERAAENLQNDCPGYVPGSPNMDSCPGVTSKEQVNHEQAFGLTTGDLDWTTCNLPQYPSTNSRACYRTRIRKCPDNRFKIYLNKRNFKGLSAKCTNETKELPQSGDEYLFRSPRYKCEKPNKNSFYNYRHNEFCLYNFTIRNCPSERVLIETEQRTPSIIQERNGTCKDYLQFYYKIDDTSTTEKTRKYCGADFDVGILDVIPATQFIAVFWTDTSDSYLGFSLRVRCQEQVSSGEYSLTP